MELLELQSIWTIVQRESSAKVMDPEQVQEAIHRQSRLERSRLRRALRLKLIIGSLVNGLCLLLIAGVAVAPDRFNTLDFLFTPGESLLLFTTLFVSLSTMLAVNYRAFRNAVRLERSAEPIQRALNSLIGVMRTVMRVNIYSDALVSPLIFTWGIYAYGSREGFITLEQHGWILVVVAMLLGLVTYFFQGYAQHLKFGRYVQRLQEYVDELSEKNGPIV